MKTKFSYNIYQVALISNSLKIGLRKNKKFNPSLLKSFVLVYCFSHHQQRKLNSTSIFVFFPVFQALVHDIYSELVEDACLGLCFEVHRAVKQGYFFLDDTDQESLKEFGKCSCLPFITSCPFFFFFDIVLLVCFPLLFQKQWISQELTYLAKCTISGKTRSANAPTARD